ncbi:MAG: hypothetical protein HOH05_14230 [Marinovum sp.]|nr:hypothetical protein [Marinovum sp.]
MSKLAVLNSLRQAYGVTGPASLLVIWGVCAVIGWGSVGRHSALILWLFGCAVLLAVMGLVCCLAAGVLLRRLRSAHRRFEHQGRADAQKIARIAGMRFQAYHLSLGGLVLGASTLVALSMEGLAISGGLIAGALVATLILVERALFLNRSVVAGVTLFLTPVVQKTSMGREALNALSHAVHVQSALSMAHEVGENGLAAREFLATVRHEDAFWPNIETTLDLSFGAQLEWRIFAFYGAAWHAISALVVAILLAYFAPVSFFPPLASPLDLMASMLPSDAQSGSQKEETPSQDEDTNNEGAGSDGGEGGGQGEGADGGEGGGQNEGADGGEGGGQGEGADGGEGGGAGGGQNEGADGGEGTGGGDDGASHDGTQDPTETDMQADSGGEGTGALEAQVTVQDGVAGGEPEEREISIGGLYPETDGQEGRVLEGQAESDEGDPKGMTAATLTGGAMEEIPHTETMPFDTNPFSARGVGPDSIEVLQTDIPEFPDNLPNVDPPTQRVPTWILQLEGAIE